MWHAVWGCSCSGHECIDASSVKPESDMHLLADEVPEMLEPLVEHLVWGMQSGYAAVKIAAITALSSTVPLQSSLPRLHSHGAAALCMCCLNYADWRRRGARNAGAPGRALGVGHAVWRCGCEGCSHHSAVLCCRFHGGRICALRWGGAATAGSLPATHRGESWRLQCRQHANHRSVSLQRGCATKANGFIAETAASHHINDDELPRIVTFTCIAGFADMKPPRAHAAAGRGRAQLERTRN